MEPSKAKSLAVVDLVDYCPVPHPIQPEVGHRNLPCRIRWLTNLADARVKLTHYKLYPHHVARTAASSPLSERHNIPKWNISGFFSPRQPSPAAGSLRSTTSRNQRWGTKLPPRAMREMIRMKRRIISCAQLGSRTYERTRTNQEVYYQPTGTKTQ